MRIELDLTSLASEELKSETLKAAKNEKASTHILLAHIAEVDRRWLFAEWGYEKLHTYIRDGLGYSDYEAYERASAAKLLRQVPEVKEALENGGHTLTSAAKLSSYLSREKATKEEAVELVKRCENQSTRAIERILVSESTQTLPTPDKIKSVSAALTRLTLEVDQEFMVLVTRMKELKGNPAISLKDLFQAAMEEFTNRREVKTPKPKVSKTEKSPSDNENKPSADSLKDFWAPQNPTRSRHIPASEKNKVRLRSNDQCEYRDPTTGRRCECRIRLEFDHYPIPFAMGGVNTAENLRHTCRTHNQFHAIQIYGEAKMSEYLRH